MKYCAPKSANLHQLTFGGNHNENRRQSGRGKKKHEVTETSQQNRPAYRSRDKTDDYQIIVHCFGELSWNLFPYGPEDRLRAAAQISRTHGRGEWQAVNPPESLHLQGADKGNQRIDLKIKIPVGDEHHRQQTGDFQNQHRLMPDNPPGCGDMPVYQFGGKNTQRIKKNRQQILAAGTPLQIRQIHTEKHHVSGDGVGEHFAAIEISINIQKPADNTQNAGGGQTFGVKIRRWHG